MMTKDTGKRKKENILPIILGMLFIAAIVVAVLFLSKQTKEKETQIPSPTPAAVAADDGKLLDYEKEGIVTLADYKSFKETGDPADTDDWEQMVWDDYLAECKVTAYPDELLSGAVDETRMQYESFAAVNDMTYEELLESYGMDENTVNEVAKDTVKSRLVAKTIAYREGFSPSDDDKVTYLMKVMDYDEGDKDSLENLLKDYSENYGSRPMDDVYVEMAKELLLKNNPGK